MKTKRNVEIAFTDGWVINAPPKKGEIKPMMSFFCISKLKAIIPQLEEEVVI